MSSSKGLLSRGLHSTSNTLSQNFVQDENLNFSDIAQEQVCYCSEKLSKDPETNRNPTVSNKNQDYLITIHVIVITLLHYFRDRNLFTGVSRKHFKLYCVKKTFLRNMWQTTTESDHIQLSSFKKGRARKMTHLKVMFVLSEMQ